MLLLFLLAVRKKLNFFKQGVTFLNIKYHCQTVCDTLVVLQHNHEALAVGNTGNQWLTKLSIYNLCII